MNKKAWVARDYVIAIIIFSALIALAFLMIQLQGIEYNREDIIDENFNESFNKFEDHTLMVKKGYNATSEESGLSPLATFDLFFESTFTIIRLTFGSLPIVGNQIVAIGSYFNIDKRVTVIILGLAVTAITAMLIFIVISSISRGRL